MVNQLLNRKKTSNLSILLPENIEAVMGEFTDMITKTAKITIGILKNSSSRLRVPWWNNEIKKLI